MAKVFKSLTPRSPKQKFEKPKQEFLDLIFEQKRKFYKCGGNFTRIEELAIWAEHGKKTSTVVSFTRAVKPYINIKIGVFFGDVTTLEVDILIINARKSLAREGGIDKAIHEAAGPHLQEELNEIKSGKTSKAIIVGGYKLPARHLILAIGPILHEFKHLEKAYKNALKLAMKNKPRTIAIECLSTGPGYEYPNKAAAHVALNTIRDFMEENHDEIEVFVLCIRSENDRVSYDLLLPHYFKL